MFSSNNPQKSFEKKKQELFFFADDHDDLAQKSVIFGSEIELNQSENIEISHFMAL